MSSFVTTQPGKAIWTLFAVAITVARIPYWLVCFIPSFLRQNSKWTYQQALRVRLLRVFLYHASIVQIKTPTPLAAGAEKGRFIVAEPASRSRYTGPVSERPSIRPERVGGTWFPAAPPPPAEAAQYDTVVLHFHGGAYVIGDGRDDNAGFAAKTFLKHTPATRVYSPQYRLASNAGGAFPAPLQDGVTALSYLLDVCRLPADRIVISGDSAGANLAAGLVRYLAEHGDAVGLPRSVKAVWLWSPWVHPGASLDPAQALHTSPNSPMDYLNDGFGRWGATALGSLQHEYVKMLGNPFATQTPVYVSTGECEVLFQQDVQFAQEMRGVKGNVVELSVEENAVHDIILVGAMAGFEVEAARAAKRAGQWLEGL